GRGGGHTVRRPARRVPGPDRAVRRTGRVPGRLAVRGPRPPGVRGGRRVLRERAPAPSRPDWRPVVPGTRPAGGFDRAGRVRAPGLPVRAARRAAEPGPRPGPPAAGAGDVRAPEGAPPGRGRGEPVPAAGV